MNVAITALLESVVGVGVEEGGGSQAKQDSTKAATSALMNVGVGVGVE